MSLPFCILTPDLDPWPLCILGTGVSYLWFVRWIFPAERQLVEWQLNQSVFTSVVHSPPPVARLHPDAASVLLHADPTAYRFPANPSHLQWTGLFSRTSELLTCPTILFDLRAWVLAYLSFAAGLTRAKIENRLKNMNICHQNKDFKSSSHSNHRGMSLSHCILAQVLDSNWHDLTSCFVKDV